MKAALINIFGIALVAGAKLPIRGQENALAAAPAGVEERDDNQTMTPAVIFPPGKAHNVKRGAGPEIQVVTWVAYAARDVDLEKRDYFPGDGQPSPTITFEVLDIKRANLEKRVEPPAATFNSVLLPGDFGKREAAEPAPTPVTTSPPNI